MTTTSEPSVNTPPPGGELPPATLEGWFVLHQSFRIDWPSFKTLDADTAAETLAQFQRVMDEWTVPSDGGWSGAYRVAGAGVDLLVIHFRENLDGLIAASHSLALTDLADSLLLDHEYVSVVELGLYALTADLAERVDPNDHEAWQAALAEGLEAEREKAFVRRRLYPVQPDEMPYVCYYPMDKRREPSQNWYKLSLRDRAALMKVHGSVGRRYAGRISQVISGSMGLADWEWAVTLWAPDPLEFKHIISEMRYDEASAKYAEFGQFLVGKRMTSADVSNLLPRAEGS